MKLTKSKNYDVNYLAQVIKIDSFQPHPNPKYTKIKQASVGGFNVFVSIDSEPGLYVYFPVLSRINPEFLAFANLFRNKSLNNDAEKAGFFEENGKVTAIKLGGYPSEGFLIQFEVFNNWLIDSVNKGVEVQENEEFDSVEDGPKSFWVTKKYVPRQTRTSGRHNSRQGGKQPKRTSRILSNQFRAHYDTVILRKVPNVIKPNDIVSITTKFHGSSGISAYVLCKPNVSKFDRITAKITNFIWGLFGCPKLDPETDYVYDYVYSSRRVIQNEFHEKDEGGYYGCNIWKYADEVVRPALQKGMTMYYEIVGFTPKGQYIQKGYDYGCTLPLDEYKHGSHFKVLVYRITLTNPDGYVHEFSAREVQQYCQRVGLTPVTELYYGYAKDLYNIVEDENWSKNFLEALANDKSFYMEKASPDCLNNVPHEGLVIKTELSRSEAWKLKAFAFLDKCLKDESVDNEDE